MATLVDNLLSALFGLDEGASQRVADASNAQGNPDKLRQNMASILETLQTLERGNLNEDWKMGMAAEGPPSWFKGIVKGGAKATKGLLSSASDRDLLRLLSSNNAIEESTDYIAPELWREMQDQGIEATKLLTNRRSAAMDRGEKWMGVHGGGVEDWNTATAENLRRAKSGFSETSNELDEAMADALERIDRGGRMMHGVDQADSIRRMNLIEAMEGFPLSNRPAGKSDVVEDMIYGEKRKKMDQMERWQKNHPGENPLGQGGG